MATKTLSADTATGIRRVERVLSYAAISVAGLGVVCIAIILIGAAAGIGNRDSGIWPTVTVLPALAFPIAVLLLISYVIVSLVRRSRENRETSR